MPDKQNQLMQKIETDLNGIAKNISALNKNVSTLTQSKSGGTGKAVANKKTISGDGSRTDTKQEKSVSEALVNSFNSALKKQLPGTLSSIRSGTDSTQAEQKLAASVMTAVGKTAVDQMITGLENSIGKNSWWDHLLSTLSGNGDSKDLTNGKKSTAGNTQQNSSASPSNEAGKGGKSTDTTLPVSDDVKGLMDSLQSALDDKLPAVLQGLTEGTMSMSDALKTLAINAAQGIGATAIQQAGSAALQGIQGWSGWASMATSVAHFFGYASGGYTGDGAKYDVAGVVHAGEYVQPKSIMNQPGALQFQEAFRHHGMAAISRFRGYADGGSVGENSLSLAANSGSPLENTVNLYALQDPSSIADMAWGRQGQHNYLVHLTKNRSQIREILGVK